MALQPVELTLAGVNGHTATLRYGLSETQGWDVRAELDDRVIAIRHCSNWRGVERLYEEPRCGSMWPTDGEGWEVTFGLNDPFRLRRPMSYTATIPFVR